jgi:energy-converting hydrogenase B subunit D
MTVVQLVSMALVTVIGTAVACTHDPLRQTLLLGIYGIALTFFFFAAQAPDVALSEIVVSTVGLPLIILAALRKLGEQERDREEDEQQ